MHSFWPLLTRKQIERLFSLVCFYCSSHKCSHAKLLPHSQKDALASSQHWTFPWRCHFLEMLSVRSSHVCPLSLSRTLASSSPEAPSWLPSRGWHLPPLLVHSSPHCPGPSWFISCLLGSRDGVVYLTFHGIWWLISECLLIEWIPFHPKAALGIRFSQNWFYQHK